MARQAFNPDAFSPAAFSAEADAADSAFDGGAFLDTAFNATSNVAPVREPAFEGGAFLDSAFFATANDTPVFPGADATLVGLYPVPGLTAGVRYISGAARPLVGTVRSPFEQAKPAEFGWTDGARDSQRFPTGFSTRYQNGASARAFVSSGYDEATHFLDALRGRYQRAVGVSAAARSQWQEGDQVRQALAGVFQRALRLPVRAVVQRFQEATDTRQRLDSSFQDALPMRAGVTSAFRIADLARLFLDSRYQDASPVRAGVSEHPVNPPGPVDPGEGETVIVPVRRIYTVINSATLRRVDGDVLIPTTSMTLTIDVDSWTWGFTARTPGAALPDLEPSAGGQPVEVEARINGVPYRALIEGITRERVFGRSDLSVTGRGKAAVLDAPYTPISTFGNPTAERSAQQLANDVLTLNGVSIGWAVNWSPEDWQVPAGVFSHQGSYMTALNAIAGAAGAYIQPHRVEKSLDFLLRYPAKPWEWGDVTPDYELPADAVQKEGIVWTDKAVYNRVFVRGVKVPYIGQVTRAGTAGDIDAPMVTDPLITTTVAGRQRGLPALADVGRQAAVSLRLPVLAETGIIPPGKFVRYVDGGVTRIGLVRSTSAAIERAEEKLTIWQTIGVETHVGV